MAKRLRANAGPQQLGRNMHILRGHQRLDFFNEYHKPGKILDVGCGEGAFSIHAKELGYDVTAIDLFDVSEHLAKYEIEFEQTSIADFTTSERYNTIVLMEVVEHLEEPLSAIRDLYYLLENNGRLLITTPHVPDWDTEEDHVWRWNKTEFEDMVKIIDVEAEVWQDNIFIYAVLTKEID